MEKMTELVPQYFVVVTFFYTGTYLFRTYFPEFKHANHLVTQHPPLLNNHQQSIYVRGHFSRMSTLAITLSYPVERRASFGFQVWNLPAIVPASERGRCLYYINLFVCFLYRTTHGMDHFSGTVG